MKNIIRFTAIFLIAGVAMSSCAPVAHDPQVTVAKTKVLSTKRTYIQGAAAGALIGAGIGAGVNKEDRGAGALVGGLTGLGVGLIYANHVVKQRLAYKNASDYLTACTGIAEKQRQSADNYNEVLNSRLKTVQREDALVRGTIKDSNDVKSRLIDEIALQETALAKARNENADTSTVRKH